MDKWAALRLDDSAVPNRCATRTPTGEWGTRRGCLSSSEASNAGAKYAGESSEGKLAHRFVVGEAFRVQ